VGESNILYGDGDGDDMLIQMIQPKLEEIETRFSNGEGLTSKTSIHYY
tara:strand:- start:371 stop:514 length:144 start_codon:yes stop_codon:yes gene_type:complete